MPIFKGPTPWAIILCKFSDQEAEPQTAQFLKDFFVNPQTGGIFDYWRDVSYGSINLEGSDVFGWFTLSYTQQTDQPRNRFQRIKAAIDDLKDDELKDVDFTRFYGIIVILICRSTLEALEYNNSPLVRRKRTMGSWFSVPQH